MSEDIRIRVIQENQGDALKKAADEKERLENSNGGKSSLATEPPNLNAASAATKQEAAAIRREAQQRNKALIADAESDLAKAVAVGASAGTIKNFESQVREQKLAGRFMREQGLSDDDAIQKAQQLVNLQNQGKARREAEKQAVKETAAAEKKVAAEQIIARAEAAKKAREAAKEGKQTENYSANRQAYLDELRALEMRAVGNKKGAEALERQNAIRKRAVDLERELNVDRNVATTMAERETAARESITKRGGGGLSRLAVRAGGDVIVAALSFFKRVEDDQIERSRRAGAIAARVIESGNRTDQIADMAGVRGEDEATENYHQARAAREALEAKRGSFGAMDGGYWDQFKQGLKNRFGFENWWGNKDKPIETEADQAARENAEQIASARNAETAAKHLAQQKFRGGTGKLGLDAQEQQIAGHLSEARAIETKILRERTYNELLEKSGSKEFAQRGADLAVKQAEMGGFEDFKREGGMDAIHAQEQRNQGHIKEARVLEDKVAWMQRYNELMVKLNQNKDLAWVAIESANAEDYARKRERAGSFAKNIDARTGAGAAARVAALAASVMGQHVAGGSGVHAELKAMHATMRASVHISDAAWRAKFSRREHN